MENTRRCGGCKKTLPITDFWPNRQRHQTQCKQCQRAKSLTPNRRFSVGKSVAKHRGIAWNLTLEQFTELISRPCDYCLESLANSTGYSLDRIDEKRGYEIGNVVPCCWPCNQTRGVWTSDELRFVMRARVEGRNIDYVDGKYVYV